MIIFLRSLIFNILFFVLNIVLCIGLLWALLLPRKPAMKAVMAYFHVIYWLEKWVLNLDYKVEGLENIPKDTSYILAVKHQSAYETLKMQIIFGDIAIILKRELTWIPLWGWYTKKLKMIPVDRGAKDKAIQSIVQGAKPVIDDKRPIVIYPQGTRVDVTDTIKTRPYKQGALRLYEAYNIPIVPVALDAGLFWPRNSFIKKSGTVTFKILPIIPAGLPMNEAFVKMRDDIETASEELIKNHRN